MVIAAVLAAGDPRTLGIVRRDREVVGGGHATESRPRRSPKPRPLDSVRFDLCQMSF